MKVAVILKSLWLPTLVCGVLVYSALQLILGLLHSECEMTWMYSRPQYQKLNLSVELDRAFPQYSLHLYRETRRKVEPRLDWTPLQLSGLPVLFIPGNAGSHKQVRSSASIALQMHRHEFPNLRHFDFFTVNLNEELSGLFGGVLHRQTLFVAASVRHILSLYPFSPSRPSSVLIIAHSMGGVVAQALFTLPDFPPSLVPTIITLSSPLARPVVAFDLTLLEFYDSIAEMWYSGVGVARNVTLVSISGGDSDVQVPPHLTIPPSLTPHHGSPCATASSVPRNWVSADHQAVIWCRRLQLAVSRALFLLQSPPTKRLTVDPHQQRSIFRHLLLTGWKIPMYPDHTHLNPDRWTLVKSTPHYQEGRPHLITALPLSSTSSLSQNSSPYLLVATNSDTSHWLFACCLSSSSLANCTDLSTLANILPPREKVVKYAWLSEREFKGASHVVAVRRKMVPAREGRGGEEFLLMEWCQRKTHDVDLPVVGSSHLNFPHSSHCTLTTLTLPHLTHVWTAHSAMITSSCVGVKGGLVLPWLPHTPLLHDNGTGHLNIPLSLQVPVPAGATPELLVWTPHNCTFTLSLSPSFLPLASKLLVFYSPLLLPWITAVALSSQKKSQLFGELVILAVMWGATSCGVPPWTDWEQLTTEGLWTAWGPLLIHIVARGLFQMLHSLLNFMTYIIQRCLPGKLCQFLAVLLMALWIPASALCGAAGLLCVLAAYTIMVTDVNTRHVHGLLACVFALSLPSLFSWLKNIRYSMQLSPDPLFWPVGVVSALSLLLLLLPRDTKPVLSVQRCGFILPHPLPLDSLVCSPSRLLSLSLLLYATTHTYRLAFFSLASVCVSLAIVVLPHIIHHLPTRKT